MADIIAIACGQRNIFPVAHAVWFADGRIFHADNDLGRMWNHTLRSREKSTKEHMMRKKIDDALFTDLFTSSIGGQFSYSHYIYDKEEAESVIKKYNLKASEDSS
ncbi:MAG: hypothetical protein CMB80_01625 [Flammeovirgaceae bacterium]|nr:hypothetical protein [Flammeovirgaceae bacterium]